jgi:hypothetical protein
MRKLQQWAVQAVFEFQSEKFHFIVRIRWITALKQSAKLYSENLPST